MKYFIYIIIFLLSTKDAYSNFELNKNIQNAYSNIISLNFKNAKKFLDEERIVNPKNGLIYLNVFMTRIQNHTHGKQVYHHQLLYLLQKNIGKI